MIIRTIWALCLAGAAINHLLVLLNHGVLYDYGGVGWISAAYWSSLTFIDPLAATLLFGRPRAGIIATLILMVSNVAHNLVVAALAGVGLGQTMANPLIASQIAFLLFVAATAPAAWKGAPQST